MLYIVLLLIFFMGNGSFTLLPWYHIHGVFRLSDLGLLLIVLTFLHQFFKNTNRQVIFNGIGKMVFLYLVITLIQVANASANYNQSIFSGLIQSRHQFYYLSYYVFLLVLIKPGRADKFMKYFSWMAFFIVAVSLINYFGLTLFHHRWGEGQGIRFGIMRAYIPGMDILGMALLWYVLKYTMKGTFINKEAIGVFVFFMALLFRQTRGRIIAAVMAAGWLMLRERQFKMLAYSGLAVILLALVLGLVMKENILISSFETAYTDVSEQEGTWAGRMVTIQHAWDTFLEHPVIGSGAKLIRQADSSVLSRNVLTDAYQGDLGYIHWLKNYGILGIIWLVTLAVIVKNRVIKNCKKTPNDVISKLGEYQLVHIIFGFITIDYLGTTYGILVFCLALALLHCRQYEVSGVNEGFKENSSQDDKQIPVKIIKKKAPLAIKYTSLSDSNE